MNFDITAAGSIWIKLLGLPLLAALLATMLSFMVMWPRSRKEAVIRICSSIIIATFTGPVLVAAVLSWWPALFDSANAVAVLYGCDPATGFLFIAAPLMAAIGLPAWWVLGACVRWFDRRRDKDIGELAADVAAAVKEVRSGR
ncbi:hypothetical protein [Janthinobacterium sp. RB2R34]|uniref:hypothetical protein n=1 Tax=Janthinobacterium sp. RB2R34 TaxID=3424193 RepID=UPI003F222ECD